MTHKTTNSFDDDSFRRIVEGSDEDVKEAAFRVLAFAKDGAPVDTGALVASLEVEKLDEGTYRVGSDLRYAAPVELGYRHHASGRFIPAQPYLRPALDAAQVTE